MTPRETLEAFDRYLTDRGLRLDAVVIGGAALNLLGVISRATKDCDILDLLRSKLFALCDRGFDLGDCLALAPTADELGAILPWVEQQDGNPDWPAHVRATLAALGRKLGHGV
jgi:hypothetical protein